MAHMDLTAQIEALLFIETKPVTWQRLAKLLEVPAAEVEAGAQQLQAQYVTNQRGLAVLVTGNAVQLTTAPEAHDLVSKVIKDERTGDLTRPALETLAIVAYRSPVTKAELEMIRGINCSMIIRNLLIRGLIAETFDKTKGVPVYDITTDYLQLLGVSRVNELPDYEQLHRAISLGDHLAAVEKPGDFFQQSLLSQT